MGAVSTFAGRPLLVLEPGEVHVWRASLNVSETALASCSAVLSAGERERAARYRFARDRAHFIAARAFLRAILGAYTGRPAAQVHVRVGRHGKPVLADAPGPEFNLSHSGGIAIYAVSDRRVGVDVERIRPMPDALAIAARFFSAAERLALEAVESSRLAEHFFTCWTRKEAYLKARGDGIGSSLRAFSVSVDPERPALIGCETGDDPSRWTLVNLQAGEGFAAALAVDGAPGRIVERTLPEARLVAAS
jgi:4'-phosphopantetheinyl transferase